MLEQENISNSSSENEFSNIGTLENIKLKKEEKFWWYHDNENMNYQRSLIFIDNKEHIVDYLQ
ncbi:7633_t:CDS:1, partial [Dentiscutata heterogama]